MTAAQKATAYAKLSPKEQHYARLNDRFDVRAFWLRKLGYKYEYVPGMSIAVFTLTRQGKTKVVPAALVSNADEIVWGDYAEEYERFTK